MPKITSLQAREILDSRENPTVAVELVLDEKFVGKSAVPSGASAGKHEAVEMRDGDFERCKKKGVLKAIGNIQTTIKQALWQAKRP